MLCGLAEADSGTATILGFDLKKQRASIKNEIGYLSQKFSLYSDLTVDENIEFFAELHGVKNFRQRREELLEFTRLSKFRKFLAGKLSGGMKQKLALSCTLIHKPKIIFLDEPTTGVDPVSRRDFWKILSELHNEGVTIVVSTPYMDEAERFNTIAMMNAGRLLMSESPKLIKASMQKVIIEIITPRLRDDRIDIAVDNYDDEYPKIEKGLESGGIKIDSCRVKPVSLENVFIHMLKAG
jgi:ABC-2 type transport system ATP-binding protein